MENRAKDSTLQAETLRTLSHDMRAPLSNVIALAQMSLSRLEAEGQAEASILPYLRRILVAAQDMELLTREALGGEDGAPRETRFFARELAASVAAAVGEQARKKGQMLLIDVSGLGEAALIGDRAALVRCLINLTDNAVKYTQPGGRIALTARTHAQEGGRITARFSVEDNGMGMDEAFLSAMFEPHVRAAQAVERGVEGFGLGLASVRRLAERMGASVSAQSAPGKGTRFDMRVPLFAQAQEKLCAPLAGMHILLAEDNDLSAEIERTLLCAGGAQVSCAPDGAAACDAFLAGAPGTFDLILMDMHMPGMDGCRAARRIRESGHPDARSIPLLALTAGGDAQDENSAHASGMNACLTKPLDVARLCRVIGRGAADFNDPSAGG